VIFCPQLFSVTCTTLGYVSLPKEKSALLDNDTQK